MIAPKRITEDTYMEGWTLISVRTEAKRLLRRRKISGDLKWAIHEVLADLENIETQRDLGFQMFSKGQPTDTLKTAEYALRAGIRWTAILWQSRLSTASDSRWGDPVWQIIVKINNREQWKPSRVIRAAMNRHEAKGKSCQHDFQYYQKHFRKIVKTHTRGL